LKSNFFDVGIERTFFLGNFTKRLNLLHKQWMNFAGNGFLLCQSSDVASKNIHQNRLHFIVERVARSDFGSINLSCTGVDGFSSQNAAVCASC
jgi:hypothetical protein